MKWLMDPVAKPDNSQRGNKALISAYACEPHKGSEPLAGWNWATQISTFATVWVITRSNNRKSIEAVLAAKPLPHAHFVYFDLPRWARFWKRGQFGTLVYYYLWQIGAYFVARRLHRKIQFDLVHHVTFVKYWAPSFLSLLPVPFLWGPVGGGDSTPGEFSRIYSLRGKVYEAFRHFARQAASWDPFVRLTARRAELALAATRETEKKVRALGSQRILVFSQIALPDEEIARLGRVHPSLPHPFRVVSVGSLLHLKGLNLAIQAFERLRRDIPDGEYWIVGDGPERKRLEALARRLGLEARVAFWGRLSRSTVLEKLAECDALLHPALHESGGWVCLEAMSLGCPVVCLDLGGSSLQVTQDCGVLVPAISPEQAVCGLADGLRRLARNPSERVRLGEAARARVAEHFSWSKKAERIQQIYADLISASENIHAAVYATTLPL